MVLQRMQDPGTARNVAIASGVSESTISRTKAAMEDVIALLYQLGFKVVDQGRVCVDRASYEAMAHIASKAMSNKEVAQQLIWEGE